MGNSSFRLVSSFSFVRVISFAIQIGSHCSHVIWTTKATEVPQKLDIISECLLATFFQYNRKKKKKKSFTFLFGKEVIRTKVVDGVVQRFVCQKDSPSHHQL